MLVSRVWISFSPWDSHALTDNRTWSQFLSLIAFSVVTQCVHWITHHMAQPQGESSTVKKDKAWWSHEEDVSFLDYLINYWSEVTWGSFKVQLWWWQLTPYRRDGQKQDQQNKQVELGKFLILISISIDSNWFTYIVEGIICNYRRIQVHGIWCNMGQCPWCMHQQ